MMNNRWVPASGPDKMFDGVLLVDKPIGPTSHDVVHRIRRFFNFTKVGHGGTLDPMASGLLIILLGKGTRLSSLFLSSDKVYEGTLRLGIATDTQDAMGEVIRNEDPSFVTEAQVRAQMEKRIGDSMQMPPMTSAIKIKGVPLYKHARKGLDIERKPRLIHLFQFKLTACSLPEVDFVLKCTKGTYVRTLCADIGEDLGCGAHLSRLRRTQSGAFAVKNALQLADVLSMTPDRLATHILPMRTFL